ncbi:hypothetical protein AOLI_G00280200 [Acnodon oligacanthus]
MKDADQQLPSDTEGVLISSELGAGSPLLCSALRAKKEGWGERARAREGREGEGQRMGAQGKACKTARERREGEKWTVGERESEGESGHWEREKEREGERERRGKVDTGTPGDVPQSGSYLKGLANSET